MPTPKKGARLGAGPSHQRLLLAGLATQLFEHGRITTTEAKARTLRPVAEKLITKAKKADLGTVESLHQRREVLKTIRDKEVVHQLFAEIAPRFADRPGGYTRITKIGPRKGDNAPMAVIELVTEDYTPSTRATTSAASTTAAASTVPAATPVADETEAAAPVTEETTAEDTTAVEATDADAAAAEADAAAAQAEQAAERADAAAAEAKEAAEHADEAATEAEQAAEAEDEPKA